MPEEWTFRATVQEGRGGGAFVEVPFDGEDRLGTRGRVPVVVSFDGEPYRGSISPMGGRHLLGITKAVRKAIGKDIGDVVEVVLRRDGEPRTVEVPEDLAAALAAVPGLRQRFDALAYTHRKEFARWISGAKRQETRQRRLAATVEKISRGETI